MMMNTMVIAPMKTADTAAILGGDTSPIDEPVQHVLYSMRLPISGFAEAGVLVATFAK
ncbi:MAG: hypothetical protein AAF468_19425 [Pseudomonadota bacterium]